MIVAGGLDADLDPRTAGGRRRIISTTSRRDGTVIGQASWGFSNFLRVASVTETGNSFLQTSIATATVEAVTGAA